MDRIIHQSPRQQGYGSTSSLRNDSLKHTQKQSCQALADCPQRRGGLSAKAARTVRQGITNSPHPCRGPSSLSRGLFEKGNRTSRDALRITDRPRGARGLSAKHPRTVRPEHADHPKPCPMKTQSHDGSKTKASKNTKNSRRTHTSQDRPPPARGLSAPCGQS
jgi:hypothetical protein